MKNQLLDPISKNSSTSPACRSEHHLISDLKYTVTLDIRYLKTYIFDIRNPIRSDLDIRNIYPKYLTFDINEDKLKISNWISEISNSRHSNLIKMIFFFKYYFVLINIKYLNLVIICGYPISDIPLSKIISISDI